MVNITRYSPLDDAFDRLFRGFVVRPVGFNDKDGDQTIAKFRADIAENDKAYTVRAELPGVKKEDIQVSIDGDQVSIGAETRHEKDVKEGERVLRSERYVGKFHRAFALAGERRHEYATLEHLLLSLTEDQDAVAVLRACNVDLDKLRKDLGEFLDNSLGDLVTTQEGEPTVTTNNAD